MCDQTTSATKLQQEQAELTRRAWGLLGQLVMRGIIPPPDFDLGETDEYEQAGMRLHNLIMDLTIILPRIDADCM